MANNIELSLLGDVIKAAYEAEIDTNAYTDAEKEKVAAMAAVALSGSYSDLINKPSLDFIPTSQLGAANGVAMLDGSGKVPMDFLNVSGLTFKGAWNPATNTPTLLDGTGSVGDFYKASQGGTYNFGNGEYVFNAGDWVIFAAGVWQRIGSNEMVTSVNGRIGAVVLTAADVGALPTSYSPPVYTPPAYEAIHVQEQQPAGTDAGASTAGVWTPRNLNAVASNTIVGATLASRSVNLPAGTYKVEGVGCAYYAGATRLRVTASGVPLLHGISSWSSNNQINNYTSIRGIFTLAAPAAIQLQHRVSYGNAQGWGKLTNYDGQPEVYAELMIEKIN